MRLDKLVMMVIAAAGVAGIAAPLSAQEPPPSYATASLGLLQFEFDGSGLAPMVAVRAGTPVTGVLLVEGSLSAARPEEDFGTSTVLMPEAQLQLGLPFTSVRPYLGLGAGAALDFRGSDAGGTRAELTISGTLGARTWLSDRWGLVVEFRARGIGADFDQTAAEYTAGATWRL